MKRATGKSKSPKRREFANSARISDRGPSNPMLGNRAPMENMAPLPGPPTSGMSSMDNGWDYFRQQPDPNYNQAPESTITPGRVLLSVRMRWNPIRGLTPERLTDYLEQWRLGFFRMAGMTWDAMERRDYQLQIVAPKRKKAVARHGWEIIKNEKIPAGMEDLAEQQAQFLDQFWSSVSAKNVLEPDEKGGFALLARQMMDAEGKRYSVHEIIWQPAPDGSLSAQFLWCPIWWFEGTRGKLRFLQSEFTVYGVDMFPGDWLVTCGSGLMEACSVVFIFKHLPLKSLLAYIDKFATPGILGKTDAPYGSPEWNQMMEAVRNFAEDYSAVTNRNGEISLIEAAQSSSGGNSIFIQIIEMMDRALTTLWRGSNLSTTSQKNETGASVQEDEGDILETDDAIMLGETLNEQVSKFALEWKFGAGTPMLAYLQLRTSDADTTTADLATDTWLNKIGFPMTLGSLAERYKRPLPEGADGNEIVKAAAPELPPGAKPGDPQGDDEPGKPEIDNEQSAAGVVPSAKFTEAYLQDVSAAVSPELNLINRKIASLLGITDMALLRQRASQILQWIAANEGHLQKNPALLDALHNGLSTAFMNGLAQTHTLNK